MLKHIFITKINEICKLKQAVVALFFYQPSNVDFFLHMCPFLTQGYLFASVFYS